MTARKQAQSFAELVAGRDPLEPDRVLARGLESLEIRAITVLVKLLEGYSPKAPTVKRAPFTRLIELGLVIPRPGTASGARLTPAGYAMAIHAREFGPHKLSGSSSWLDVCRLMTEEERAQVLERAREVLEGPENFHESVEIGWPPEWSIRICRTRTAARRILGLMTNPRRKPKPLPWNETKKR